MRVKIQRTAGMSNTTFHRRCRSRGQCYWWLREQGGDFVAGLSGGRGDRHLDVELDLAPGTYVLGTGPRSHGYRETIEVPVESSSEPVAL